MVSRSLSQGFEGSEGFYRAMNGLGDALSLYWSVSPELSEKQLLEVCIIYEELLQKVVHQWPPGHLL